MSVDAKTIPELPGVAGSPLVSLEHFNVNVGEEWNDDLQSFWFEVRKTKKNHQVSSPPTL